MGPPYSLLALSSLIEWRSAPSQEADPISRSGRFVRHAVCEFAFPLIALAAAIQTCAYAILAAASLLLACYTSQPFYYCWNGFSISASAFVGAIAQTVYYNFFSEAESAPERATDYLEEKQLPSSNQETRAEVIVDVVDGVDGDLRASTFVEEESEEEETELGSKQTLAPTDDDPALGPTSNNETNSAPKHQELTTTHPLQLDPFIVLSGLPLVQKQTISVEVLAPQQISSPKATKQVELFLKNLKHNQGASFPSSSNPSNSLPTSQSGLDFQCLNPARFMAFS